MFPIDGEFITLYLAYLAIFVALIIGFVQLNDKKEVIFHSVVYGLYLTYMIYCFSDSDNFESGGGLVVLGFGGLFLIFHLGIFIVYKIFKYQNYKVK